VAKQKLPLLILGVVAVVTAGLITALLIKSKQLSPSPATGPTGQDLQSPTAPPLPTKTPQEIEIISKTETKVVIIRNSKFDPETLTIKLHDQVVWKNQDTVDHKVAGKDWGKVLIQPGENLVQTFDKAGVYPYTCVLHPTMTATIIVK
jgi:plastocyanin